METLTPAQLAQIFTLLQGVTYKQFLEAVEPGLFETLRLNQEASGKKAREDEQRRIDLAEHEQFRALRELIRKTVHPECLIVTRPQMKCDYQGRSDRYQLRFWKDTYGHFNRGGDVSKENGRSFLFEHYCERPQPDNLNYPNAWADLSGMYYDSWHPFGGKWEWGRETVVKEFGGSRPTAEKIDVFRLHQSE